MNKEYILKDGMFYSREITERCLGSQQQALADLSSKASTSFPNITAIKPEDILNQGKMLALPVLNITLTVDKALSKTLVSTRLPYLPFGGDHYNPDTKYISPREKHRMNDPEHFINTTWQPPSHVAIVLHAMYSSLSNSCDNVFLTITDLSGLDKTYVPPYPNCYPEGRMCMGEDFEQYGGRDSCPNFLDHFKDKLLIAFYEAPMNGDLTTALTEKVFKFDKTSDRYHTDTSVFDNEWWQEMRLKKPTNDNVLTAVEGVLTNDITRYNAQF